MAFDEFFSADDFTTPSTSTQEVPLEDQYAPVQRGVSGDIASRLARGGVSAVELAGEGLEVLGVKTPLSRLAQESRRKFDFLKPDIDEFVGNEGFLSRGIKGGIEGIIPSLAAGAPGAIAGAAAGSVVPGVGTAVGGTVGAILSMVGMFGLGTYGQTKKEALAQGLPEEEAHDVALKAGTIEAGGEALATGIGLFSFGLGKAAAMPMKSVLKTMIKTSPKEFLEAGLKTAAGELGTEVPQAVLGAMNREAAGLPTEGPVKAGFEAIVPAMTMSFLFSSGAGVYNSVQQDRLLKAINSDNDRERAGARGLIAKNLRNQDDDFANAWNATVQKSEETGEPIDVTGDFVKLGNQLIQNERLQAKNEMTFSNLEQSANEIKAADEAGQDAGKTIQDLFEKKKQEDRNRILGEEKEARTFEAKARLSVLAANDAKNTEIMRKMQELGESNTISAADRDAALELLADTAEAMTASSKPMAQERAVELADKVITGTATPQDLQEINFEKLRKQSEGEQKKPKVEAKKPVKPTRIQELEDRIDKGEELSTKELEEYRKLKFPGLTEEQKARDAAVVEEVAQRKAEEEALLSEAERADIQEGIQNIGAGFGTGDPTRIQSDTTRIKPQQAEAINVTAELAGRTEGIIEEPVDTTVRKTGRIAWKETAPGIFEGSAPKTQKDITLVKERADKKSPYSVIVGGKTVQSGLTLEKAKTLAEGEVQDTEWSKGKNPSGQTTESLNEYEVTNAGKNKVELRKDGVLVSGGDKSKFKWSSVTKAKQFAEKQMGFEGEQVTPSVETKVKPKKPVVKIRKKTKVLDDKGRAYILEDIASAIFKAGMKLKEFASALRTKLGTAYNKIQGKVKSLYDSLNKGLEKTTGTPAQQGGVTVERNVPKGGRNVPKADLVGTKETIEDRAKKVIKAQAEARESTIVKDSTREQTKDFFESAGDQVRKIIQPISTRLAKIHPKLGAMIKAAEGFSSQRVKQQSNSALPFLRELQKLNDNDSFQLKAGLLNPKDRELADDIFTKHPTLKKAFDKLQREVFDVNQRDLDKLGLLPVEIENWFPRVAKDPKAIYNALKKEGRPELISSIDKALLKQQKLVESKGGTFSEQDAMSVIAKQVHSGQFNQIPNAGSTKYRVLDHIPSNLLQHYGSLEESVMTHIYEMNEMIFARKLTGNTGRQTLLHKLRKLNKQYTNAKSPVKKESIKKQYDLVKAKVEDIDTDMQQSLAATLQRIGVDPDMQDEASKLIRARILQRGMHGAALTLKNVGLGLTIGNPLSAITQLGDQAQNIYKHKGDALAGMMEALSTNDLTNRFDLDAPLREFGKETGSARKLDKLLEWSGLKSLDMFGKESFLQAAKKKFAKMSSETFEKHFENFADFIEGDLRSAQATMKGDSLSTDALTLLFAELSDAQPVSPSETSEAFLGAGNARMFWMLKQFALKQMDSIVRETANGWKTGGKLGAAKNFIGLVGMLGLAGAGTDEIKNIILGREGEGLTDSVMANLMQLFFINRYSLEQGLTSGRFIEDYLGGVLIPPIGRQAGTVVSDIVKTLEEGEVSLKSLANVPLVGRVAYDRLTQQGADAELKRQKKAITKDIREEGDSLANIRKRINRFNKRARKSEEVEVISLGLISRIRKEERKKQLEK